MARNHPAFSPTCAAVLLGVLSTWRVDACADAGAVSYYAAGVPSLNCSIRITHDSIDPAGIWTRVADPGRSVCEDRRTQG